MTAMGRRLSLFEASAYCELKETSAEKRGSMKDVKMHSDLLGPLLEKYVITLYLITHLDLIKICRLDVIKIYRQIEITNTVRKLLDEYEAIRTIS